MRNAAIVACLLLGACSNLHTYVRSGTDSVATQSDIEACKSAMAPYAGGDDAREVFDKCMAGKGYEKKVEKYHL